MGVDPTSGMGPLLPVPPITIAGVEYRMRRLGRLDFYNLVEILRDTFGHGAIQLNVRLRNIQISTINAQLAALIAGLPETQQKVGAFLASLIGVEPGALDDPEKFPMGTDLIILGALTKHPDAVLFFDTARAQMEALAEMWTQIASPEPSTDSNDDTDGPTPTA